MKPFVAFTAIGIVSIQKKKPIDQVWSKSKMNLNDSLSGFMKKINEIKVVSTVFRFEVAKGHLNWKVTEISRYSGVNRTLIYYYFGKTKKEIFNHCFEVVMNDFYGFSPERLQLTASGKLIECLKCSYSLFQKNPEFMAFYFYWRFKKSPIQDRLIEIENAYRNRLKILFPYLNPPQLQALHAAVQGILTAPFLTEQDLDLAIDQIVSPYIRLSKKSNLASL